MDILFAPAARAQMFELVVELRGRDRARAVGFVDDVERKLRQIAAGEDGGRAVRTGGETVEIGEGVRLFYWVRAGDLWVLALKRRAQPGTSSADPQ